MSIRRKPRKASKRPVSLPGVDRSVMPTSWDKGADGPANRLGLVEEAATDFDPATGRDTPNPNSVKRYRRVDMLEKWARDGTISAAGYNAAVALRNAFEATMRAPGWPDNDRVQSSPKPDHAVAIQTDRVSAFHRVNRLVAPQDQPIINFCVLHGMTPNAMIDRKRDIDPGKTYAAHLVRLAAALDRLAAAMATAPRRGPGNGV